MILLPCSSPQATETKVGLKILRVMGTRSGIYESEVRNAIKNDADVSKTFRM